jgi:hypothetical protein
MPAEVPVETVEMEHLPLFLVRLLPTPVAAAAG